MKRRSFKTLLVTIVCALAVGVVALVGCGGKAGGGTLTAQKIEETGAFQVTADNADRDAGIGTDNAVTLKEGDELLVSPDLTKGRVQVTLKDKSENVAFDKEVTGRVLNTYEVAPGTYDVKIVCKEAGTTGTVLVTNKNAKENAAENKALEKTLEEVGAEK